MQNGSMMMLQTVEMVCIVQRVKIYGNNRTGLLVDITKVFTEKGIDINAIHSKTSKQDIATIDVSFSTKGREELTSVIEKLRQIESVIDIERTTG